MIIFVAGLCCGAILMFCVSCFIYFPLYKAAMKHLAQSEKLVDEQAELFNRIQQREGIQQVTKGCSCGPVRSVST